MPTVYDVPQDLLIKRLAEYLRRLPQVTPPMWSYMVKTGSHAERPPADREWWYTRAASILRKLYLHGPLGLNDLKSIYGGRKSRGSKPAHHRDGGGSNIRRILQQLEAAGLVTKEGKKGRVLTSKGRSLLDRLSGEIFKELVKVNPELAKYG